MNAAAAASARLPDRFIVPLASAAASDAERVGPKAANLAALARAGLPTPGGFCLTADAYRDQIAALGLAATLARYGAADMREQRRLSVEIRLALYEQPIAPVILDALLDAWRAAGADGAKPFAVRSSALIEDRKGANFAGQFESFLGITDEASFITAVRACWAALWTTNARRYMENHGLTPGDTAMAVLIQPLIEARASGGGLSENAEGQMLLSATWGLGSAIAQGEVVPDRIVLSRQGFLRSNVAGRKDHRDTCGHGAGAMPQAVPRELAEKPCLDAGQAVTLGRLLRKVESLGMPVEINGVDAAGFALLRAPAPCRAGAVDAIWAASRPARPPSASAGAPAALRYHRAVARRAGDILVTRVAGPRSAMHPRRRGRRAQLDRLASRWRAARFPWCSACATPRKFRTAPRSRSTASPASYG
jgi:pyruvate,water dikinase